MEKKVEDLKTFEETNGDILEAFMKTLINTSRQDMFANCRQLNTDPKSLINPF